MEISQRYLPEEMLVLIFLRLPVKTLMLFRMVCKLWYDIITSSSFTEVHRKTSSTNSQILVCAHYDSYSLISKKESPSYRKFYYKMKSFGIDSTNSILGPKVTLYGSCDGLLCVSEGPLQSCSSIYLLNPIIGKVKKLPRFPIEINAGYDVDLCFGKFNDDYKVTKIVIHCGAYHVGVYSLSTDSWKITHCDSNYGNLRVKYHFPLSKCVGGVAYFVNYWDIIACFDLHDEKIKEVEYPQDIDPTYQNGQTLFFIETFGESLAIFYIMKGHLAIWVLRNCGITNTLMWEKNVNIDLQEPDGSFSRVGFTNNGSYVLKDISRRSDEFYLGNLSTLWDLRKVQLKDITCDEEAEERYLLEIYPLVGTLVLVNEQTIDSFVGTEPCSTGTKEGKQESLHKERNNVNLHGGALRRQKGEIKNM